MYETNNEKKNDPYFEMNYLLSVYFTCSCQNLKNLIREDVKKVFSNRGCGYL